MSKVKQIKDLLKTKVALSVLVLLLHTTRPHTVRLNPNSLWKNSKVVKQTILCFVK